jgi:hypothetical protein
MDNDMADMNGVKIADLTASGSSDDGEHVWITHRLGDGSEYPLVYPYGALGYLITVLRDAARSAYRQRAARRPQEAVEGMDSNVIRVDEIRVGTASDNSGAVLHVNTADNIPIAFEVPSALVGEVAEQLRRVADALGNPVSPGKRLH